MKKTNIKKLTLGAMFVALGLILPFFTAQMEGLGSALLPMHIPVLLCGLICGAGYGALVGCIVPLLRSVLFSMPPLYPNAICMAFELAAYGFVIGFLYGCFGKKGLGYLYTSLLGAMLAGRVVWGIAQTVFLGLGKKTFTFQAFIAGSVLNAIPGILLQLVLIPGIMSILHFAKQRK